MRKITIKNFVKGYLKCKTQDEKDKYIHDKLEIEAYVPFVKKITLIDNILKLSMFDKETGNVKVKSNVEYLLTTRIFIENYTNLTVETDGFFEEYDELKKSGLFNILFIGHDEVTPLIPYEEITEFKFLLSKAKEDILTNKYEIHSFITEQVDRLKTVTEVALTPLADVLEDKIQNLSDEDKGKILDLANKLNFKEV